VRRIDGLTLQVEPLAVPSSTAEHHALA